MQNLKETQDKVYQEVKSLLQEFSGYSSEEDFIKNIDRIKFFTEKVSELKIYNEVEKWISDEKVVEEIEMREAINFEIDTKQIIHTQEEEIKEEISEIEEVVKEEQPISEKIDDEYFLEKEVEQNDLSENLQNEVNEELEQISNAKVEIEKEDEEERLHEERRKIVEIEKPIHPEKTVEPTEIHESPHHSKKFKLSHIKGLQIVQSLFDDDHLMNIPEETKEEEQKQETPPKNPSLQKNNMPTDYLEAEKLLPDFKLDINDKIAFTKVLFGGSQVELNEVVAKLNSFKKLDQAKDYLSDVYYERNWQKVDEYAQRLWSLVENKFL